MVIWMAIRSSQSPVPAAVLPSILDMAFLSENAEFAEACRAAGLVFIGPRPEVIAQMGDKIAAKAIAAEAGVPVVPGFVDADEGGDRDAKLIAAAGDMSYPLLVKASAGGGGRGMRIVKSPDQLEGAIENRPPRSKGSIWQRPAAHRALYHQPAPRRGADLWRQTRQCRPPARARLLGPAPSSKN